MKSDLEKITNSTWFQSMYALIMWLRGVSRSCWRQVSVTEKVFRLVSIFSSTFVSLFYEPPKQYYFSSTILSIFFCFPMRHLFFCRPFSSMYLQSQPAPPWSYLCRQSSHLNYTVIKAATCQPIPHSRVILLTFFKLSAVFRISSSVIHSTGRHFCPASIMLLTSTVLHPVLLFLLVSISPYPANPAKPSLVRLIPENQHYHLQNSQTSTIVFAAITSGHHFCPASVMLFTSTVLHPVLLFPLAFFSQHPAMIQPVMPSLVKLIPENQHNHLQNSLMSTFVFATITSSRSTIFWLQFWSFYFLYNTSTLCNKCKT